MQIPVGALTFDVTATGPEGGQVVILLHGFPQTSACWRHVVPVLADAGYRVLAPDQRGYSPGARPEGVAAYHSAELTADVLGIADAVGVERFHLVGHDWGASIAWQLAARHGDRLLTVTPISVPHPLGLRDRSGLTGHRSGAALVLLPDVPGGGRRGRSRWPTTPPACG